MNVKTLINTDFHIYESFFYDHLERNFTDIPELSNPYWILYWTTDKAFSCKIDKEDFVLEARHFLLVPPFVPFKPLKLEKTFCVVVQFFLPLELKDSNLKYITLETDTQQKKMIEECIKISMASCKDLVDTYRPNLDLTLAVKTLLNLLFLRISSKQLQSTEKLRNFYDILFSLIMEPDSSTTLEKIAQKMEISLDQLKIFIESNTSLKAEELITHLHLRTSWNLLKRSQIPLDKIAIKLGYPDLKSFSQKFKEIYHCSPEEVRLAKYNQDLPVLPS